MKNLGNDRILTTMADVFEDTQGIPEIDLEVDAHPIPTHAPDARYVELGELGRGGLGVVLEAFDQDLRRVVALKRPLARDRIRDADLISLVREAQITAQLEHPNIPAVHSLGIDPEGRPFFTMTRLRGASLSDLLEARAADPEVRDALSTPRQLRIVLQLGYALASAHARGVVHRDIKPDNVIIGDFGEVRLMDWGIARLRAIEEDDEAAALQPEPTITTTAERAETSVGTFMGTPGYAAPEQIQGSATLDARADIYAVGALLYEMVSGRPPVHGTSFFAIINKTLEGEIAPLGSLVPVDKRLAAIAHKALATSPDDRYDTILEFVKDIEALLEDRPVSALDEGTLGRARRAYLSPSSRVGRLRTYQLDALGWGTFSLGIASGLALMAWLPSDLVGPVALACLVLGLVAVLPAFYTLVRKQRPDDPSARLGFIEGAPSTLLTSRSSSNSEHTVDGHSDTVGSADEM